MMTLPPNYNRQVYTAVLGKTIGVYLGRPFEGWTKDAIEEKWGTIDHYVHEDQKVPLVVADDDISGTFTFIRALTDSGLFAETPPDFFGKTWRNYLLENQTILWWGGMSHSTEHTAWIRLKQGYESPASGSMALNGKEVAEQIGAQIFIDAFGMVAPGDPETAQRLARMAASVSHDGEAVVAAEVVAMLVSLAFVEKDMDCLLDAVLARIPGDSLIARVHRDVRAWAAEEDDWHRTYDRIHATYGYDRYGGNCHIIPNHALMVMAWAYAKADFFKALSIVATAGWDTDCNAANVGTVSALVAGLDHLSDSYDFRTFADRIFLPTSDGTDGITDCLRVARFISTIGRTIAHAPVLPSAPLFSFSEPGAFHGFLPDDPTTATLANPIGTGLDVDFLVSNARISTPISPPSGGSGYALCGTPLLTRGMTVSLRGSAGNLSPNTTLTVSTQYAGIDTVSSSPAFQLTPNAPFSLTWTLDDKTPSAAILSLALSLSASGSIHLDSIDFTGIADLDFSAEFTHGGPLPGWISNVAISRGAFSNDSESQRRFGSNGDPAILVTGNRHWADTSLHCNFNIHAADRAGVLLHYQGMQRYLLLEFTKTTVRIVRQNYGETILAETPYALPENTMVDLTATVRGSVYTLFLNGTLWLTAVDDTFPTGGSGFFVQTGLAGASNVQIKATYVS